MICEVTHDETERFRAIIARRLGLRFEDSKRAFLSEILDRRLKSRSLRGDTYLWELEHDAAKSEFSELARELTVGETYFFRNNEQFRALAEIVLPERLRSQRISKRLTMLSAGCSSGEEAYSMAIVAQEVVADRSWNVAIHAADINPLVIEKAKRARYSAWALRETPLDARAKWFHCESNEIALNDSVRNAVTFELANLASDESRIWRAGSYDVIFCRNVLMYFEPEQMRAAIERIARSLSPGGYLFLGHAETLRSVSERFHLCHTHDTFYYQLKDGSARDEERILYPTPRNAAPATSPVADVAWFDNIRLASERVAALVPWPAVSEIPLQQTAPRFDTAPVLDLLRKERFGEALDCVRREGVAADGDPNLLLLEAMLLTHGGQLAAAEDVALRLLASDAQSAGAHYVLALCREHAGQNDRAVEHHRSAARLDSTFAMPALHLGLLARRSGDVSAARRDFARALSLLEREQASRLLLFGGGFSREALMALCSSALADCEARS